MKRQIIPILTAKWARNLALWASLLHASPSARTAQREGHMCTLLSQLRQTYSWQRRKECATLCKYAM
eukprot:365014-Chlamydomonas_euryale.AAC.8